ncbi:MAG TPA: PH domain-containing protein [Jatrophihabitantaceae bacterium]|nr:PH domain-containing protein [Jatrophihabitantaceae bacterium]
MNQVDKYLLPSERAVVVARRHWAVMLRAFTEVVLVGLGLLLLLGLTDSGFLGLVCLFYLLFSVIWLGWQVLNWYVEEFAVTDKRVLLVSGLIIRNVAIMPLIKVTDLTYKRDLLGRILGFGTFIIESAGQEQALSRIDFVNHPDEWYRRISAELFGRTIVDYDEVIQGGPPNPTDRLPRV